MALAWDEYGRLEGSVEQLRAALQAQMSHSAALQVRAGTAVSDRPSEPANECVALSSAEERAEARALADRGRAGRTERQQSQLQDHY